MDTNKQIYTYSDVCLIINKSRSGLYHLIKAGVFPPPDIVINSRLKFYSKDLLEKSLREVFKIELNIYNQTNENK